MITTIRGHLVDYTKHLVSITYAIHASSPHRDHVMVCIFWGISLASLETGNREKKLN